MTRSLRILAMCSSRRWIGEAAHVLNLSLALRDEGHEVMLAVRKDHELEERARQRQLTVLPLNFSSGFSLSEDLADRQALRSLAREFNPDIVHVHRSKEHWLAALTIGRARPLVRTRHVVMPVRNNAANRWLYRQTSATICVSQAARSGYEQTGLLKRMRTPVVVIYPGLQPISRTEDLSETPEKPASTATTALVVARLQRIKGHDIILEAIARRELQRKGLKVRFIGAPKKKTWCDELVQRIADLGLSDCVSVEGYVDADTLTTAYRTSDFAIIASRGSEGWSRAACEAMSAGLPIIATRVGALPEILLDGESGLLVEPEDPDSLATAMERLLGYPELRQQLGQAGRRRLESTFDGKRWIQQTLNLYHSLLQPVTRDSEASVLSDGAKDRSVSEDTPH